MAETSGDNATTRKPLQFSLAALMLLIVVAAIPTAWLAHAYREGQREALRIAQLRAAYEKKVLSQREAIDELILEQMKQSDFKSSKLEYCRQQGKSHVLDFLVGKDVSLYPQLTGCGFVVTDQFLPLLQQENAREWMEKTGSENEYLAFKTDIWDFRDKYVLTMDTLLIAIHDGRIVEYEFFADVPY